ARGETYRDLLAGWIVSKIVEQIWHQRHSVRKFFFKEAMDIVVGFGRREAARSFEFPKQRARKRAIGVRKRDHHETFARPDVERVLFHLPRTIRSGRNRQLLVAVGEITLVVLEIVDLELHRLAHGGEGAIDPDDAVG